MKNEQLLKYHNPVILKDEQGKVRQTIYNLPPEEHTYGKKVVDDPQPLKYVINGWQAAHQSAKPASTTKNFQELNRQAITSQLHTSKIKQQSQFRQTKDLMVQAKEGQKVIPIMLPQEQFTYGVGNRPSTPMKLVMGNCYALEADQKKQQLYQSTGKVGPKKCVAKKTKSQALRQQVAAKEKSYQQKDNLQQGFKLSKYTSMGMTKVDTGLHSRKA